MQETSVAVSFVDTSTLQLRFELGRVVQAGQTDQIPVGGLEGDDGLYYVDGIAIGRIVGRDNDRFQGFDEFFASPIADLFTDNDGGDVPRAAMDVPANWIIRVNGVQTDVTLISRKNMILETGNIGAWDFRFPTAENVFLKLDRALNVDDVVTIDFDDADFERQTATFDPSTVVSEAIHVNLRGFDPDDAHKVAYLSSWNGWTVDEANTEGGFAVAQDYAAGMDWRVVDSQTGQTVLTGETTLFNPRDALNSGSLNLQGTDVFRIDFSSLDDAGQYHIVVDGVGRSNDFALTDQHWADIYDLSMQGFLNQRSGIALGAPYSGWERERSMHPDDGLVIYETTLRISDTDMGYDLSQPEGFDRFAGAMTGETLPQAWGGWHDAGDWDRRTQHIEPVRKMIDLWEQDPRFHELHVLPIPENGNAIPDVLDEALWTLDFFMRLQRPDGGVRGGVESEAHPNTGDGSWNESLRVFAYDADPWTSWEYAAAAAKMAGALERYDAGRAAEYRDSALRAMEWAEDNIPTGAGYDATHITSRNLAAVEMYRLAGDDRWHDLFVETFVYQEDAAVEWFQNQWEAAYVYAQIDGLPVHSGLRQNGIDAVLNEATLYAGDWDRGGFGGAINPYAPYGGGNAQQAANEASEFFLRAHVLTGDDAWLTEMQEDVQYLLGANPLNMPYLTGLGDRSPYILNVDAESLGSDMPPGITIYGDYAIQDLGWQWFHGIMDPAVWANFYVQPGSESYHGFFGYFLSTEYTVMDGMIDTTTVTGYLAAQRMADAVKGTPRADRMNGTGADDVILSRDGDDRIDGGAGDDLVGGGAGKDRITGGAGRDIISGEVGRDLILGGTGADRLSGGAASDRIDGGGGQDLALGGAGSDSLMGQSGADILFGHAGVDRLNGGAGDDILLGGAGSDLFVLRVGGGMDRVQDFVAGVDRVQLLGFDAVGTRALLTEYGRFSDGRQTFTLSLGDGDALILSSDVAMTWAQLTSDFDLG